MYVIGVPVTSAGAVLSLAEAGVSLTIPEGALAAGQQEEIYLAVLNDAKDRPQLGGNWKIALSGILVKAASPTIV